MSERVARHPGIRCFTAYSRPEPGEAPDHKGRLDASTLAGLTDPARTDYYLCGPLDFMADLTRDLVALGADPEAVRSEAFEATGGGALSRALEGRRSAQVTFSKSKKTATWTPEVGTLLDLAVSEGVDVAYSCRMGDCQSCAQRLLAGRVDHPDMQPIDLVEGQALLCQALPDGDITVEC